jgi:conjugal transfer pilus assembly protein TrbC
MHNGQQMKDNRKSRDSARDAVSSADKAPFFDDKFIQSFVYEERTSKTDIIYLVDWRFKERFDRFIFTILSKKLPWSIKPYRKFEEQTNGNGLVYKRYSLFVEVIDPQAGKVGERLFYLTVDEMELMLDIEDGEKNLLVVALGAVKLLASRVFACGTAFLILAAAASAAELDQDTVNDLIKRRDELVKSMSTSSNTYDSEARKKAAEIMKAVRSTDFQARIKDESDRLKATVFKDQVGSIETTTTDFKTIGRLGPDERLYVFVSSSMPLSTIRNYVDAIHTIGDPEVIMVMNGFVGGVKNWRKMVDFSSRILAKDPLCDPVKTSCNMYAANLEVDPLLFRRYGITRVPTFVYARGINRIDPEMSEGLPEAAEVGDYDSIQGDVSFAYVLETFRQETRSASMEALFSALERGVDGR